MEKHLKHEYSLTYEVLKDSLNNIKNNWRYFLFTALLGAGAIEGYSQDQLLIEFQNNDAIISKKEHLADKNEYTNHVIKSGESLFSIAQKYQLMELSGKNIYEIIDHIKEYNIANPSNNYNYQAILQGNESSIISEFTDINQKLPSGYNIWIPAMKEYQLSYEEKNRQRAYNKLFEGHSHDAINLNKNLRWGSLILKDNISEVTPYLVAYHKKLIADGYHNKSYNDVWREFKDYNKQFCENLKKMYGVYNIYDGVNDKVGANTRVQIPLYKHITPKTIINDLTEKEKYANLDQKEEKALGDILVRIEQDKLSNNYSKYGDKNYKYAIIVNTCKKKGKHQVLVYDLENQNILRRYICSTGNEPAGIYTPKGICRIASKFGEGEQLGTFRDPATGDNPSLPYPPLDYDTDGNFCVSPWNQKGATIVSRMMRIDTNSGINFHGTNRYEKLGYYASHGCVRMLDKDVIELFDIIPEGSYVNIMDPRMYR